jgi:hypothetical protein
MNTEQVWLQVAAKEILNPLEGWAQQCHAASMRLMNSGRFGTCRVARGWCKGVGSQHSWLVIGDDCYDQDATIIDGTLWSYDKTVDGVWVGAMRDGRHGPHGSGSIWNFGRPTNAEEDGEDVFELTPPSAGWSDEAQSFFSLLGPMSRQSWIRLAHYPVEGWPAGEIINAICESGLEGYVPVDIIGMNTDRNPRGLYLPTKETTSSG